MSDKIKLPKCGAVLTIGRFSIAHADVALGEIRLTLDLGASRPACSVGSKRFSGTRDECIAWMDDRVLAIGASFAT